MKHIALVLFRIYSYIYRLLYYIIFAYQAPPVLLISHVIEISHFFILYRRLLPTDVGAICWLGANRKLQRTFFYCWVSSFETFMNLRTSIRLTQTHLQEFQWIETVFRDQQDQSVFVSTFRRREHFVPLGLIPLQWRHWLCTTPCSEGEDVSRSTNRILHGRRSAFMSVKVSV